MTAYKVTEKDIDSLAAAAKSAVDSAYAPYSKFRVGAALLAQKVVGKDNGQDTMSRILFAGANIENANYSLTLHAEHAAVAKAVARGYTDILAIVIYTPTDEVAAPCGSCRQVLNEFSPDTLVISFCNNPRSSLRTRLSKLLPHAFGPHNLEK